MVNLNLQMNESVILQSIGVCHGGIMAGYTDELILTNINIILIKKGIFGKTKDIQKFKIKDIRISNDYPQVSMAKNSNNGNPELHIYFRNEQQSFAFQSGGKKEIQKWINHINQLLTGVSVYTETSTSFMAIPGTEQVAETIRDTIGLFKEVVGIKSNKPQLIENTTVKCIGCRASVSGKKGQNVRCQYCDTVQTL